MLQPRLESAVMDMVCQFKNTPHIINHINVHVQLWKSVGLCIHQNETETWAISHFVSGRRVLHSIPTKEKAIKLMLRLRKEVIVDWRWSCDELNGDAKKSIGDKVKQIQQTIMEKETVNEKFQKRKR